MTDLAKLAAGTVKNAEKVLPDLSGDELRELHALEKAGEGRVTLLGAIEAELDDRPMGERDAGLQAIFNQGRFAAKNGITCTESPHSAGPKRDAWVQGWKSAGKD
jgi:ribosome modulation factor